MDTKTITVWPDGAVPMLQDCFETTDWQIFREAATSESSVDLEEYTSSVLGYIRKCMEDVTTSKTITIRPNQKPWLNAEVRSLLRTWGTAFRDSDVEGLKAEDIFNISPGPGQAIILQKLVSKLSGLGTSSSLCTWVLDFLTCRPQSVRINKSTSSTIILNTGSPQGCVLSPLLFTLMTSDCRAHYKNNLVVKFADDTAVVGLITQGDELEYMWEVEDLTQWCGDNNLTLNIQKTKEMVVDHLTEMVCHHSPHPLHKWSSCGDSPLCQVPQVHLTNSLTWHPNTTAVIKKAHQRLYFLRKLKRAILDAAVLKAFYSCVVESVLTSCLTVWYGSCTVAEKEALQRVVKAAQRNIGCSLPPLRDIYTTRCRERALSILHDPTHPAHELFTLWKEAAQHPGLNIQTEKQLLPRGCQTAELLRHPARLGLQVAVNPEELLEAARPDAATAESLTHITAGSATLSQFDRASGLPLEMGMVPRIEQQGLSRVCLTARMNGWLKSSIFPISSITNTFLPPPSASEPVCDDKIRPRLILERRPLSPAAVTTSKPTRRPPSRTSSVWKPPTAAPDDTKASLAPRTRVVFPTPDETESAESPPGPLFGAESVRWSLDDPRLLVTEFLWAVPGPRGCFLERAAIWDE
ncbi:hypothetical protein N1851_014319 [Merluccius polli]|uniref:Reverse transcriptase domain-containing protein n=1 Tax=Merluccius polli TaxID=89951 RepID=A0AA47P0Y9_MERPO|nr:hypothetical protein N1851_014319 [Merluccius polli]